MAYYIHVYALPVAVVPPSGTGAEQVPAILSSVARKVGELEMSAGESSLFAGAVEELTGADVLPLWHGALWGVEPGEDGPTFGAMDAAEAQAAVAAIRAYLDAGGPDQLSAKGARALDEAADTYAIDGRRLHDTMRKLADLLARVLSAGMEPAAVYE